MFSTRKQKFLFKCEDCAMILSADFDDEEDLEKIQEDSIELECPCGGRCRILHN